MPSFNAHRRQSFYRGDLVEVRSATEIAATLDVSGQLDGLPFMPEMASACGQRFRVFRRADKTCVEGLGLRRLQDTVFLDGLRCDGAAHDGCERGCLMFWKEAWLKPASAVPLTPKSGSEVPRASALNAWVRSLPSRSGDQYVCQSTALASATTHIPSWDIRHLVREVATRELTFTMFGQIVVRALVNKLRVLARLSEIGGIAGDRARNPKGNLSLQPGERVAVRSAADIAATLDPKGRNQGLSFEPDMSDCTGRHYEVEKPVRKIILEQTGRMAHLTNTVTLKGVTCQGLCSKNCPRSNPIFWREIWLQRSAVGHAPPAPTAKQKTATQAQAL